MSDPNMLGISNREFEQFREDVFGKMKELHDNVQAVSVKLDSASNGMMGEISRAKTDIAVVKERVDGIVKYTVPTIISMITLLAGLFFGRFVL